MRRTMSLNSCKKLIKICFLLGKGGLRASFLSVWSAHVKMKDAYWTKIFAINV